MAPVKPAPAPGVPRQVVYAPSCVTRMMGPAAGDNEKASVHEKLLSLFEKAGYEVIYPEVRGLDRATCAVTCAYTFTSHAIWLFVVSGSLSTPVHKISDHHFV